MNISNRRVFANENKKRRNLIIIIHIGRTLRLSVLLFGDKLVSYVVCAKTLKNSGLEEGREREKLPFSSDVVFNWS